MGRHGVEFVKAKSRNEFGVISKVDPMKEKTIVTKRKELGWFAFL